MPLVPKVEGSLVRCARGYALSYVRGDGAGTRSVAIGSVVCFFVVCVYGSVILCCSPGHRVTWSPCHDWAAQPCAAELR